MKALCVWGIGVCLAGCAIGPRYRAPEISHLDHYRHATSIAEAAAHQGAWWQSFNDPALHALIQRAIAENPSLAAARARVKEARAQAGATTADLWPQIDAQGSLMRQRVSPNAQNLPPALRSQIDPQSTVRSAKLKAAWELDLWGQTRNRRRAAMAQADAEFASYDQAAWTLTRDVAQRYFERLAVSQQLQAWNQSVTDAQRMESFQRQRVDAGLDREDALSRARSERADAEAQQAFYEDALARQDHALAVLCGQAPSAFVFEGASDLPEAPKPLAGIPSDLLTRRPDLRRAEQTLRAATAEVGVAQAAFLPSFELVGSGGFESLSAKTFLDWESRVWALGPSVTLPLFQGGRNRSQLAQAKARLDERTSDYRYQVLLALRDVEDAFSGLQAWSKRFAAQEERFQAIQQQDRHAMARENAGLVSTLERLRTTREALAQRAQTAQTHAALLQQIVTAYEALGGSWDHSNSLKVAQNK